MRQIRLEQKKASVNEKACTEELLLRVRAVDYLRRHEKIKFEVSVTSQTQENTTKNH